MQKILPLEGNGAFYKGNLHCHSTLSDGRLVPERIVDIYRKRGYSFLAFSEHELFTDLEAFNTEDFLIIPAIECGIGLPDSGKCYHLHGIQGSQAYRKNSGNEPLKHGMRTQTPEWKGLQTVQKVIDELKGSGNLVMLNHPVWSLNELEDFISLEGCFAMEIFNYGCEVENKTGLSTVYWDSLLRRGIKMWGIATDDNHNGNPCEGVPAEWDSFGGWVNVKAEELSRDAIADALSAGRFYSSSGPEIFNYGVIDGEVFVECSPVATVYFITYERRGYSRRNSKGSITKASFELNGDEKYVRIECQDMYGKTAWTNPIFF